MENLHYNIREKSNNENNIDIYELIKEIDQQHEELIQNSNNNDNNNYDNYYALELYYKTNYNIKTLGHILDYYQINKRKLRKDEMIQLIVMYENEKNNIEIVEKRRRLWENFKELISDPFFSKFIIFRDS
jgi:hypothetical protein